MTSRLKKVTEVVGRSRGLGTPPDVGPGPPLSLESRLWPKLFARVAQANQSRRRLQRSQRRPGWYLRQRLPRAPLAFPAEKEVSAPPPPRGGAAGARVADAGRRGADGAGAGAGRAYDRCACKGLHKSGTHILAQYVRRFFGVAVRPLQDSGRVEGAVRFGATTIWKHTLPSSHLDLPPITDAGPVATLLTVREALSWMASLSRNAYEIFSGSGNRGKQYSFNWMFNEVELRPDARSGGGPVTRQASAIELWATYVGGNLDGRLAPGGQVNRAVVVRHQDLVERPCEVVEALARLGLPRNAQAVEPIEEPASRDSLTRAEILHRECAPGLGASVDGQVREAAAAALQPHEPLVASLGYRAPVPSDRPLASEALSSMPRAPQREPVHVSMPPLPDATRGTSHNKAPRPAEAKAASVPRPEELRARMTSPG